MMNAPFLESSEQLNSFFPASLNKIKFHIFKKSEFLIHGLRQFKQKNMCELCDTIPDKVNKYRITANKCFVLHEEVIDIFYNFLILPQYKNFHLIFIMSGLLVQWNLGRLEIVVSAIMH